MRRLMCRVMLVLPVAVACQDSSSPPPPVSRVAIHPDSAVVQVDSTITLTADVLDAEGRVLRDRAVAWLAFDTTVARADAEGNLHGVRVGPTEVVAASESVSARAPVAVVVRLTAVAQTSHIACALSTAGQVYCWGMDRGYPQLVEGGPPFIAIFANQLQACGLTSAGKAYCWGYLASPDSNQVETKTPAAVNGDVSFTTLALGFYHRCGLTAGGSVYCWGEGFHGATGVATADWLADPQPVTLPTAAISIATGDRFSCAVLSDGAVYCWGDNTWGQIGDTVYGVHGGCGGFPCRSTPTRVDSVPAVVSIGASASHVCGLTSDGTLYCWGYNWVGQLGITAGSGCYYRTYHDSAYACSYVPHAVPGAPRFTSVALGAYHTCGAIADRSVLCWGDNLAGAFGTGQTGSGPTPVPLAGGIAFQAISPGYGATCGIPVSEQVVYCWGGNWWYALGTGTTAAYDPTPRRVLYQP